MKILIVPNITNPKSDSHYFLVKNMIALFTSLGHQVAICAKQQNQFRNISLFDCPSPKKHVFPLVAYGRSYEEWMYSQGYLDKTYILQDLESIQDAIEGFSPDCMIAMDRPAALIASIHDNIPCHVYVHPAMYRNISFPNKCMHGINQALAELHFEQEIDLKTLYAKATRRFAFGPMVTAPFQESDHVSRIGSMTIEDIHSPRTNRVCIYLSNTKKRPNELKKIVTEAFSGAPYNVYVYIPGISSGSENNLHFLRKPEVKYIPGCSAVIHDGNDFFFQLSIHYGIPQLIIAPHTYSRQYNGMVSSRYHIGAYMYEEELKVSTLYEGYRKILVDDIYYESVQKLKKESISYGDLHQLIDFMYIDLINQD